MWALSRPVPGVLDVVFPDLAYAATVGSMHIAATAQHVADGTTDHVSTARQPWPADRLQRRHRVELRVHDEELGQMVVQGAHCALVEAWKHGLSAHLAWRRWLRSRHGFLGQRRLVARRSPASAVYVAPAPAHPIGFSVRLDGRAWPSFCGDVFAGLSVSKGLATRRDMRHVFQAFAACIILLGGPLSFSLLRSSGTLRLPR